jgi:hypothetical protein
VPVVLAQRAGNVEPLMFQVSLLALLVGARSDSFAKAAALGLLVLAAWSTVAALAAVWLARRRTA